jgi:hypothetical protein
LGQVGSVLRSLRLHRWRTIPTDPLRSPPRGTPPPPLPSPPTVIFFLRSRCAGRQRPSHPKKNYCWGGGGAGCLTVIKVFFQKQAGVLEGAKGGSLIIRALVFGFGMRNPHVNQDSARWASFNASQSKKNISQAPDGLRSKVTHSRGSVHLRSGCPIAEKFGECSLDFPTKEPLAESHQVFL